MSIAFTLKNLSLSFPHKVIFNDVTFTLNRGDRVGLLGLNGHGKSSLFKIITEELKPDTTPIPFVFDKTKDFSVFLVPQELPIDKTSAISIEEYFYQFYPNWKNRHHDFLEINKKLSSEYSDALLAKQQKIIDEMVRDGEEDIFNLYKNYLKRFKLNNLDADIRSLSGGEQRRVALALGLSSPSETILWDEPTNHLDLDTIEIFEEEILSSSKSIMMISHDRTLLTNVVDRILHIKNGKLNDFKGTYPEYLVYLKEVEANRIIQLEKLSNYERVERAWISRGARARRTKSKKRIENYSELKEKIGNLQREREKNTSINLKSTGRETKILFNGENLSIGFQENRLIYSANFKISAGEKVALLGKSGVGKSTFIATLLGLHLDYEGQMKSASNLKVGYFSQKREILDPEMTPWELIGEGIDHIVSSDGVKRHVASYLKDFLFEADEIQRPIKTFSGGEKNRLQLAKFMKDPQDLWIFDEPTNDLDLVTISILEDELNKFKGTLLLVSHDRSFIENVTHRAFLIIDQKIEIFEGGVTQALEFSRVAEELHEVEVKERATNKDSSRAKKQKRSYAEEELLKKLTKEISDLEKKISNIDHELSQFDYNKLDKESQQKLTKLNSDKSEFSKLLDDLTEKWLDLESKD